MGKPIYPCLWMDNEAKEAALFYCSVFLGTVENPSAILSDNQMVVSFQLLGNKFPTLNGGPVFQKNPSISFFVVTQAFLQMTKFVIEKLLKA